MAHSHVESKTFKRKRTVQEEQRLAVQDKAEAKLQMLEKKAQEQQKARLAADEEWRQQQRERELARLRVCTASHPVQCSSCTA